MAYLDTISELDASGEVGRIYRQIREHLDDVPALFKLLSVDPLVLREIWRAYPYAMEYGALGRAERELVALAVSRINACRHGMDAATQRLNDMGMAVAQIEALFRSDGEVDARLGALIQLAARATATPASSHAPEVDAVRRAGFDQQQIRELATVTVWTNLFNRLVDGFGVPHEPPPPTGALQTFRTAAHEITARFRRAGDSLPHVDAMPEAGAGETAVVLLRQLLERLEPLPDGLPETFREAIQDRPRRIRRAMIRQMREDGLDDRTLFRAAVLLAGQRSLSCWDAVVRHLDDPLSGSHAAV